MGRDVKSRGHRRHHASGCHSPKETTRKQRGATALRPPLAFSGGETRIRTEDKGFAGLCLSHLAISPYETGRTRSALLSNGAGYGVRTRDLHLGKVARYQLRQARERTDTIRDPVARCKHDFEKAWLSWSTGGRSADDGSPGCLATISCCVQPLPLSRPAPVLLQPSSNPVPQSRRCKRADTACHARFPTLGRHGVCSSRLASPSRAPYGVPCLPVSSRSSFCSSLFVPSSF